MWLNNLQTRRNISRHKQFNTCNAGLVSLLNSRKEQANLPSELRMLEPALELIFETSDVKPIGKTPPSNLRTILKWLSMFRLFHSASGMGVSTCKHNSQCQQRFSCLWNYHCKSATSHNHRPNRDGHIRWCVLSFCGAGEHIPGLACSIQQMQTQFRSHCVCDWWQFSDWGKPQPLVVCPLVLFRGAPLLNPWDPLHWLPSCTSLSGSTNNNRECQDVFNCDDRAFIDLQTPEQFLRPKSKQHAMSSNIQ